MWRCGVREGSGCTYYREFTQCGSHPLALTPRPFGPKRRALLQEKAFCTQRGMLVGVPSKCEGAIEVRLVLHLPSKLAE